MNNTKQPFASRAQLTLIGLLGLSFVLLTQQANKGVYQAGFLLLIVSALLQIIFSNIPATASFKKSMLYLVIGIVILGGVFVLGIVLAPSLVNLGRG
jgi:hypothetical protein